MAIPDKPLEVALDPAKLTLGEVALFEPGGFRVTPFIAFLERHTNWTRAEIENIAMDEIESIAAQLTEKIQAVAVPLVSKPS